MSKLKSEHRRVQIIDTWSNFCTLRFYALDDWQKALNYIDKIDREYKIEMNKFQKLDLSKIEVWNCYVWEDKQSDVMPAALSIGNIFNRNCRIFGLGMLKPNGQISKIAHSDGELVYLIELGQRNRRVVVSDGKKWIDVALRRFSWLELNRLSDWGWRWFWLGSSLRFSNRLWFRLHYRSIYSFGRLNIKRHKNRLALLI